MSKHHSPIAAKNTELLARAQAAAAPTQKPGEMLELLMQLLAQELLTRKAQGRPLSENLPLLDRLMRYEALQLRREALRVRESQAKPAASGTGAHKTAKTSAPASPPQANGERSDSLHSRPQNPAPSKGAAVANSGQETTVDAGLAGGAAEVLPANIIPFPSIATV